MTFRLAMPGSWVRVQENAFTNTCKSFKCITGSLEYIIWYIMRLQTSSLDGYKESTWPAFSSNNLHSRLFSVASFKQRVKRMRKSTRGKNRNNFCSAPSAYSTAKLKNRRECGAWFDCLCRWRQKRRRVWGRSAHRENETHHELHLISLTNRAQLDVINT